MDNTLQVAQPNLGEAKAATVVADATPWQGAPWERQPGEGAAQYRAFCRYRAQQPGRRSVAALNHGRSHGANASYSTAYRWAERAAMWDEEIERRSREAAAAARVEACARVAARAAEVEASAALRLLEEMPTATLPQSLQAWETAIDRERQALGIRDDAAAAPPAAAQHNMVALVQLLLGNDAARAGVADRAPQWAVLQNVAAQPIAAITDTEAGRERGGVPQPVTECGVTTRDVTSGASTGYGTCARVGTSGVAVADAAKLGG